MLGRRRSEATREGAGEPLAARDSVGEPATRNEAAPRRPHMRARRRAVGAAAADALSAGVLRLARLVMTIAVLIAILVGLAIVLRVADANPSNSIVKGVHEGANFFAGSFTGLITFQGHPKRAIAVDWGIALVVYLLLGAILARLISGLAPDRRRVMSRQHTAASY